MRHNKAFTLIEVLIVVLILGIVAAITVPRFSNASAMARASMLADDLRMMRTQLAVFKGQHGGVSAGYPDCDDSAAPSEAALVAQMTKLSNPAGEIGELGSTGFEYGPYLSEIPVNPINGKGSVELIADDQAFPETADDSHGWVYQPSTLILRADSRGSDENGKAFFDY